MIATRQSFAGGGGGGGGNRAVIFTIGIRAEDARKQLADLGKDADALARKLGSIQVGISGGSRGAVASAASVAGAAPAGAQASAAGGTRRGGTAVSEATQQNRARARALDAMDRETEWWARKNAADERRVNQERERARRAEARYQSQESRFWDRAVREERRGPAVGGTSSMAGPGRASRQPLGGGDGYVVNRSQFGEAIEGLMQIGRAVAFLSASSKESAEEMLRTLAKFEAAAFAVRGTLKLAEPAGTLLGAGASRLGIAAGGGATKLGFAGLGALTGTILGGRAIADQIRYSQTGEIGGHSSGVANLYAGIFRKQLNWGADPAAIEGMGAWNPMRPYAQKALGDMRFEQGLSGRFDLLAQNARYGSRQYGEAQGRLGEMERMYGAKQSVAANFLSQDRFRRGNITRLMDLYNKDPNSLSDRQLADVSPWFGPQDQQRIQSQMVDRAGPLFERWSDKDKGIKFDDVKLQRELVLKLKVENENTMRQIREVVTQAYREGTEDFNRRFEEMQDTLNADLQRIQQDIQNQHQATANAYGG
jgi:hypothetical protein